MPTVLAQKQYLELKDLLDQAGFGEEYLHQEELDLGKNRNTNLFTYRGQFSPDFISNLLKYYAEEGTVVFDPFVGSGTVLIEAARRGIEAHGTEINPAAFEMANTISFLSLNSSKRKEKVENVLKLFSRSKGEVSNEDLYRIVEKKLKGLDLFESNILRNAYITLLGSKKPHTLDTLRLLINKHAKIIYDLPETQLKSKAYLTDARSVPLKENAVDLIITSPPYINVFNYHQHNRSFIDRVYGNALVVAKSEFGANRKHRQNRFLTVTQYIIDMVQTFEEMKRVLKQDGRLILVVGRSSKVRGIVFRNDHITGAVASIAGYEVVAKQERKFVNQFGETIFEAVLHFKPVKNIAGDTLSLARAYAAEVLKDARTQASEAILDDINLAVDKVDSVNPSPLFK